MVYGGIRLCCLPVFQVWLRGSDVKHRKNAHDKKAPFHRYWYYTTNSMKSQDEFCFFAAGNELHSFWRRSEERRRRKAEYLSFHKLTEKQESSILLLKQMLGCARQT